MVHTENNEKKKDNKEVKKHFKCFFYQKRDTQRNDKSRYTRDFQNFQK